MCLACEMDALWFAEMEAAARATPGSAGAPPALSEEPNGVEDELPKSACGTPAVPASPFLCKETRSE
jgi:hypothetical protein